MPKVNLHIASLVGPGETPAERTTLTVAPAYAFVDGTAINWPVPVTIDLTDGEGTVSNMETTYLGEPLVWAFRLSFENGRGGVIGSYSATKTFPEGATGTVEYADMIDVDPVSDIPGFGPSWAEQARVDALAAAGSSTTATEQAAIATTKATEVATLASSIATGSPYFMAPILTGGNLNTARPTLPGGAAWPGPVIWSSQIGRPTNFLAGTDYWEAIAADPLPPAVYLADNFNRADGAPGPSPTGAITPTVTGVGTLSILSNALGWSALASGTDYVTWDTGHADGIFEITVTAMEAAAGIGITFRFGSATNHLWMGRVSSTVKNWRFGKRLGSATFIETFGPTTTPTAPVVAMAAGDVVRVIMNGTTITININGTLWFSGTVTDHATNTKHGFSGTNPSVSGASKFDNVSMTALA